MEELRKENLRIIAEKRIILQDKIYKALNKNEFKMSEKLNEYMEKKKKILTKEEKDRK